MSQANFLKFLIAARDNPAQRARYSQRNLSQLLFHAKNEGFDFTAQDVAAVVGELEGSVILSKDHDRFDGSSRLWREMWGRHHFDYLVDCVVNRHSDEELQTMLAAYQERR